MDDIAAAAGIAKASVYYYYPSKSLMLHDILARAARTTVEAVQPTHCTTARDQLYQCTINLIRAAAAYPHETAVYLQESPYLDEWLTSDQIEEIRQSESEVLRRIRAIIEKGICAAEFRSCDSDLVAHGYLGLVLGPQRWLLPDTAQAADRVAWEINQVVLRGMSRMSTAPPEQPSQDLLVNPTKNAVQKAVACPALNV